MRQQFHRNMDKFDIYCSRNIFIPSSSSRTVLNKVESLDSVSSKLEELHKNSVWLNYSKLTFKSIRLVKVFKPTNPSKEETLLPLFKYK